jgi:hypothetical protein
VIKGWAALPLAAGAALIFAGPAMADISGLNNSIANAYGPLQPATAYLGAFDSPDDVEYASFSVEEAGESVHFDVENTVANCQSVYQNGCPMYATLITGAGLQVGGEGSSAGTGPVDAGMSDVIDWTFEAGGTYYVAFDSSGDLPTYQITYAASLPSTTGGSTTSGGSTTTGGSTTSDSGTTSSGSTTSDSGTTSSGSTMSGAGAAVSSLRVSSREQGPFATARFLVGRPLRSVRLTLTLARGGAALGERRLRDVAPGVRVLEVRLDGAAVKALVSRGALRLRLALVAAPTVGSPTALSQQLTLVAPSRR